MSKRFPAPSKERVALLHQKHREKSVQRRSEFIAGRDLVAITLSDDPGDELQRPGTRRVVLGRAPYSFDEEVFIKRISNGAYGSCCDLMSAAAVPDDRCMVPILDVFKLIMCDARCLEEGDSLQDAYEAELREEELQTPTARAREIVRNEDEKTARRNAKLIIPHLERLSLDELAQMEEDQGGSIKAIWKQIAPPPPGWIQKIVNAQQPWGFVFYKSRVAEQEFGHDWEDVWSEIKQWNKRNMKGLWITDWATGPIDADLPEDDALRRDLLGLGIRCDWEPSSTDVTVSNGEEYRGRVRVPLYSLDAWFYGARAEGEVSLKDMWLKAQTHDEKLWICYSKQMENWHHESYI
ncbi:hypothetical protein BKA56DRAFT_615512 [Ilyonectria sp. MPI-CAGE-AT-0026]|nr:hypothetical protein BKA56DRAFT_615512 [Ilyonectria sp. MPI-CAGE-AT-0026]